jgi:D-alanyl-D-alanine carboxypeptidase/D-alanyl-D-alanine-endopeptidase (penicillin-binding protein 4)
MPRRRIGPLVAALVACLAPPGRAQPAPEPPARLGRELGAIFDTPEVNALWAAKVVSLDTGAVVFERNPRLLVMPASTMKVVTLAVAAERLGWDARFTTRIEATGPIEDGVLRGDLIVTGSGDPTIGSREDAPRVLEDWACRLATLGLRRIEGRIVGDDDALPDQALGRGWGWDDLAFGYAAPVGALQYDESTVRVVIAAGAHDGAPASVRLEPASSDLTLAGEVRTTAPDVPPAVFTRRRPFTRTLEVTGTVPRTDRDYVRAVAVDNPTHAFLGAFSTALANEGIAADGGFVDVDALPVKPAGPRTLLHAHDSPPLREIAVRLMKVSQNLIAETLMTLLGVSAGTAEPDPIVAARGVYERTLGEWGVAPTAFIAADGSGLSRYDFLTADALVTVLARLAGDPRHAQPFDASLPIMGVDGTLERRLRDTPAQGRVRAKTGTLSNVRALAGYVTTRRGERLAFAFIANNFQGRGAPLDVVTDRALLALVAKDPGGCCAGRASGR